MNKALVTGVSLYWVMLMGVVVMFCSGCSQSPLSPTTEPTYTVAVKVYEYETNVALTSYTMQASKTADTCITATHPGYRPSMTACAVVSNNKETWSFWLERE